MLNPFFRVSITNNKTNYAFICGGTITQVNEAMKINDDLRADGIATIQVLQQAEAEQINYSTAHKELPSSGFWSREFDNGLVVTIYQEGFIEDNAETTQIDT